jgi:hypothetical protein
MEMADQPKVTGVYDAPGSTSTVNTHTASGEKSTMGVGKTAGKPGAIPSWVWIVALVVVLAILGMIFL